MALCKVKEKKSESENSSLICDEQNETKSLWKGTNMRQKFLLVDLVFLEFVMSGCSAVSYAFFARVVVERGGTVFDSALVLKGAVVCATIACLVLGMYQQVFGRRLLLYGGLVLTSVSEIAFGCLNFVDDIKILTALGVIFKGLCGVGIASYVITIFTAITAEYPEHISQIVGFIYTAMGCARFIAPAFGGYMYDLVGMFPPIAIWGAIPIITLPIQCILFKDDKYTSNRSDTEQADLKSFLFNVPKVSIFVLLFLVHGILGYTDIVLTVYFQSLGLSVPMAGLGTLCIGSSMAISGPVVGYLSAKRQWVPSMFLVCGSVAISGILLIFSPGQMTYLVYIGCVLLGIMGSVVIVPTFESLLLSDNGVNITSNSSLYSKISGLWNCCVGTGLAVIPILCSAIQTATGASISTMFYSLSGSTLFLILIIIIAKIARKRV